MFPISSSRRRSLRYFRTWFRFRHFPTSSSRKSFLRPTFSKPTTLPEPPFPNLAVTRCLTYDISWFPPIAYQFFLFFLILYCTTHFASSPVHQNVCSLVFSSSELYSWKKLDYGWHGVKVEPFVIISASMQLFFTLQSSEKLLSPACTSSTTTCNR